MKMDEIELMSQLNSKKELSSYLKDMGIDGAL
jgi:hypothetical protein